MLVDSMYFESSKIPSGLNKINRICENKNSPSGHRTQGLLFEVHPTFHCPGLTSDCELTSVSELTSGSKLKFVSKMNV